MSFSQDWIFPWKWWATWSPAQPQTPPTQCCLMPGWRRKRMKHSEGQKSLYSIGKQFWNCFSFFLLPGASLFCLQIWSFPRPFRQTDTTEVGGEWRCRVPDQIYTALLKLIHKPPHLIISASPVLQPHRLLPLQGTEISLWNSRRYWKLWWQISRGHQPEVTAPGPRWGECSDPLPIAIGQAYHMA